MLLSVIVPAFNERETLGPVLAAIAAALPGVPKEIIIVDDGSMDGTREWLGATLPHGRHEAAGIEVTSEGGLRFVPGDGASLLLKVVYHDRNKGKGAALQTGFREATGAVIVIQDADLEYDPQDWSKMYPLIAERKVADVAFGSRFFGSPHRSLYYHHYLADLVPENSASLS